MNRAVRGADTVLHAAAVYASTHAGERRWRGPTSAAPRWCWRRAPGRRDADRARVERGALFPLSTLNSRPSTPDSPVGRAREPYLASKAAAERVARRHQADGAPVAISYPPALLGPHDPKLGDQTARLRNVLRGLTPIWPLGGFPLGDVRDTAAVHAWLLTGAGRGPRVRARALPDHPGVRARAARGHRARGCRRSTCRPVPCCRSACSPRLVQRAWPWHIPVEHGAIYTCACATRVSETAPTGGLAPRPVTQTFADTVAWLHRAGHVTERAAGLAARRHADVPL